MRAWSSVGRCVGVVLVAVGVPVAAAAQAVVPPAPSARVSMGDAVRLALEHNHQLRAQREWLQQIQSREHIAHLPH